MAFALKPGSGEPLLGLCLSMVEKYLIRQGWSVRDQWRPGLAEVLTLAQAPGGACELSYPKATVLVPGQDRPAALASLMAGLAEHEGTKPEALAVKIMAGFSLSPAGFRCRLCGQCCTRFRDAWQGIVSVEEVEGWRRAGLTSILRLVAEERREGRIRHRAWVNPKTGEYFKRCPWLRKVEGGVGCFIHPYKPLKCRTFPYTREQAEYGGCRAFDHDRDREGDAVTEG